jgi:hypothetical protein
VMGSTWYFNYFQLRPFCFHDCAVENSWNTMFTWKCWKKLKIVEKCFHDCMFLVVFGVSFDVSLRSRTCTLCT